MDTSRCQGHTLCAMIAPESFELDDVDGHAHAVAERRARRASRPGTRSCAVVPGAGDLRDRAVPRMPTPSIPDATVCGMSAERRRCRPDGRRHPLRLRPTHRGLSREVPRYHPRDAPEVSRSPGPTPTTATGWRPVASRSSNWLGARRSPTTTTCTTRVGATRASPSPTMIESEGYRGGMLEMDDPEHRYLPDCAEPLFVAGGGQALAAVRRRDRARLH